MHSAHYILHTLHCTLYNAHYILNYVLLTSYWTIHTAHYILITKYFTLHTANYIFQTTYCIRIRTRGGNTVKYTLSPEGTPEGKGVYLPTYTQLSPNMDSIYH